MADIDQRLQASLSDRYRIEQELGRGGMATVFLAKDLKHERQVAIKVLHPELAATIGGERFDREIKLAARLQHPHILSLYDSGEADGLLYYVMPYVEGESLRDRLNRERLLPIDDALQIAIEVADALGYAHMLGIIHRDIKPENILLTGGHALVADFGIARAVTSAGGEKLTQTGMALGTPLYMSPEQATGEDVGPSADIYSLACMLYEMLAGQPPFTGPNARAIMARHAMDSVPGLSLVRDTVPEEVEDAILCALAKVPADRPQTAAQFAEMLGLPLGSTATRRAGSRSGASRRISTASSRRLSTGSARRLSGSETRRISTQETVQIGPEPMGRRWLWALLAIPVLALAAFGVWKLKARPAKPGELAGGLDPRHIAVLYFTDFSQAKDLGYLADGLTEALITDLSQVPSLQVISRNGVEPFRGSEARDSVARALSVGSLIVGSVEQTGEKVRVTVRLVDGASGADIDRKSFEEAKGSLLGIRDQLVAQVAGFLRSRLGEEVRVREQRAGTRNLDAWVLLQQAERSRKDAESLVAADSLPAAQKAFHRADSLAEQAANLDNRWTEPLVLRAQVAYRLARLSDDEPKASAEHAKQGLGVAEQALQIDPNDARALESRGTLRYWLYLLHTESDPKASAALLKSAREDLEAAVRLDPSLASAHATLSHLYYQYDDVPAVVLAARRAYEEDAYLSVADLVLYRLFNGSLNLEQLTQAERWCDEGRRRFPREYRFSECRLDMMVTPQVPPEVPQGWAEVARLDSLTPSNLGAYERLYAQNRMGGILARAGLKDSAKRVLQRAQTGWTPKIDPDGDLLALAAYSYVLLDDKDQAISILKRYAAGHPGHFESGKEVGWWWRSLQGDPRFQAMRGGT